MRKRLAKGVAMAAVVLMAAGSMSQVAYARHGHHSRTSKNTVVYATCYDGGYCTKDGGCDVDGVCLNGGSCAGVVRTVVSCYQDGSCDVDGVCQIGANCAGENCVGTSCSVVSGVSSSTTHHSGRGHHSGRHH